jgi:hypothetical protein
MRIVLPALAALVTFITFIPTQGHADPYRWCAAYSGDGGGGTNCGFITYAQCMATVSGIGGSCEINQFYTGPDRSYRQARKRYQYQY